MKIHITLIGKALLSVCENIHRLAHSEDVFLYNRSCVMLHHNSQKMYNH